MKAILSLGAVAVLLACGAARAGPPLDVIQPDGTVYHKFDYKLMAKIHAKNAEAREANRRYDPVTWLPVEEEMPAPWHKSARSAIVEEERRAARIKLVAARKQKRQSASGYDPMWWVNTPAFNPRCPWSWAAAYGWR